MQTKAAEGLPCLDSTEGIMFAVVLGVSLCVVESGNSKNGENLTRTFFY